LLLLLFLCDCASSVIQHTRQVHRLGEHREHHTAFPLHGLSRQRFDPERGLRSQRVLIGRLGSKAEYDARREALAQADGGRVLLAGHSSVVKCLDADLC
jgi:hypothetical protein